MAICGFLLLYGAKGYQGNDFLHPVSTSAVHIHDDGGGIFTAGSTNILVSQTVATLLGMCISGDGGSGVWYGLKIWIVQIDHCEAEEFTMLSLYR